MRAALETASRFLASAPCTAAPLLAACIHTPCRPGIERQRQPDQAKAGELHGADAFLDTNTAIRNCMLGLMYIRNPTVARRRRRAAPAKASSGMAVTTPLAVSSNRVRGIPNEMRPLGLHQPAHGQQGQPVTSAGFPQTGRISHRASICFAQQAVGPEAQCQYQPRSRALVPSSLSCTRMPAPASKHRHTLQPRHALAQNQHAQGDG